MNTYSLCFITSEGEPRLWFSSLFVDDRDAYERANALKSPHDDHVEVYRHGCEAERSVLDLVR